MGQPPAPPAEAVTALTSLTGGTTHTRLISDRRGSRVWKIYGPEGAVALKANSPDGDDGDSGAAIAQEDVHLRRLAAAGALSPGYRIGAGTWEGGRWLALSWIDGQPLWRCLALARGPEGDRASGRPWLRGIARTWTERRSLMHAADWAHADVQPTNILVANGHATVIDYALACGPDDTHRRIPYRGALTHTTAPEIAAAVLSTPDDTHIPAHPTPDIWSLGASLCWCWTGQRPVQYDDTADRPEKLRAIAKGATTELHHVRPWPFPEIEEAITACLSPDPADRPIASELITAW
ncbi:hypothetical protein J5J01_00430 [Streptomyces fradiae]|uniref:protein kinase domain-containing protein n=1 Tax=Streptomyces fradiae TaxID=1906 RepID=UPI00201A1B4B|nr:hypothetical protein [Streptomyces fradiae]UQS30302.1 hypothetical protein J5J01_00430 [Streptomyces fradiae]